MRPTTEGHPSAAGKGGVSFGGQLGFESPAFHYSLMNNKLNSKKNELWKMKLSK
nr:MAG TPA: hypothetical protein [Caudoviricetes sp.]